MIRCLFYHLSHYSKSPFQLSFQMMHTTFNSMRCYTSYILTFSISTHSSQFFSDYHIICVNTYRRSYFMKLLWPLFHYTGVYRKLCKVSEQVLGIKQTARTNDQWRTHMQHLKKSTFDNCKPFDSRESFD